LWGGGGGRKKKKLKVVKGNKDETRLCSAKIETDHLRRKKKSRKVGADSTLRKLGVSTFCGENRGGTGCNHSYITKQKN